MERNLVRKRPCKNNFIERVFESAITPGKLKIIREFINVQNANELLSKCFAGQETDLFSLDIDGNDTMYGSL